MTFYRQSLVLFIRVAIVTTMLSTGISTGTCAVERIIEDEAHAIGVQAYLYLYPLVTMDLTRRQLSNVEHSQGIHAPLNTFANIGEYPTAEMRAVVRPNFDTLYSSAWLDLTKEPMIVSARSTMGATTCCRCSTCGLMTGPAAARVAGELQQAIDKLAPLPGHIADPARVRATLAHVARMLHVGILNDCFFDLATALCLNGKTERSAPAMAHCRPDLCPNSCIASRHPPLWAQAAEGAKLLLREKRLSELQCAALQRDVERIEVILERTATSASAAPPSFARSPSPLP